MADIDVPDDGISRAESELSRETSEHIAFFTKQAFRFQRLNLAIRLLQVLLAFVLNFLIGFSASRTLLLFLSSSLVIVIGLAQFWQLDAKWRQYLLVSSQLKRELYLFQAKKNEYAKLPEGTRLYTFLSRRDKLIQDELWYSGRAN